MKNVIILGASGMIGNLVLRQCLESAEIESVTSVVRRPGNFNHPKLQEVVHADFLDFSAIEEKFKGKHIAFYCLGAYTGAVADSLFKQITVDFTMSFADTLKKMSPAVTCCFLSGQGADQSVKSSVPFARYKGMAENYLMEKHFTRFYSFRPAYIYPVEKRKEPNFLYRSMRVLYPLIRMLGVKFSITSAQLATAIFKAGLYGAPKPILENADIIKL
jgi:nucleoside-diphosphate-sugar epimerase